MSRSAPELPAKSGKIFYGWYILGVTGLAGIFGGATSQAFIGVFVKDIEADTGWDRTVVAGAVTIATFLSGASAALFGRVADRRGPRFLMSAGAIIYGLAYLGMGLVSQAWHLYIVYLAARLTSINLLFGVVPRVAVVNWFRRKRGRALGINQMSQPLGGAMLALVAGALLAGGVGWRTVFMIFGGACLMLVLVPAAVVMRQHPEDMGLLPDGDAVTPSTPGELNAARRNVLPEDSWTFREAIGTTSFWAITVGMLTSTWASGGVSFHMAAYYGDLGLGAWVPAAAASGFLLSGALSATIWGFLSERYSERYLVVGATAFAVGLTVFARFITEPVGALGFAVLYGATTRGEGALLMMMLAQYFGRGSFGSISGFASQFSFMGLGMGPAVFAFMFEASGSYDGVFTFASVILAFAAVMLWLARPPRRRAVVPA